MIFSQRFVNEISSMTSQECAEIKRSFRRLESKRESGPKVGQFISQAELLQKRFLRFFFRHYPKLSSSCLAAHGLGEDFAGGDGVHGSRWRVAAKMTAPPLQSISTLGSFDVADAL